MRKQLAWGLWLSSLLLAGTVHAWTNTVTLTCNPTSLSDGDTRLLKGLTNVFVDVHESFTGGHEAKRLRQLPLGDVVRAFLAGAGCPPAPSRDVADAQLEIQAEGKEVGADYADAKYHLPRYVSTGGKLKILFRLRPRGSAKVYEFQYVAVNESIPSQTYGHTYVWDYVWDRLPMYSTNSVYANLADMTLRLWGEERVIKGWARVITDCRPASPDSRKYIEMQADSDELNTIRQYAIKSLANIGSTTALAAMKEATSTDTAFMRGEADYWIKEKTKLK